MAESRAQPQVRLKHHAGAKNDVGVRCEFAGAHHSPCAGGHGFEFGVGHSVHGGGLNLPAPGWQFAAGGINSFRCNHGALDLHLTQDCAQHIAYCRNASHQGQVDALHRKVFAALHVERKRLNTEADIGAWLQSVGADSAKLQETMKSFSVATKLRQSRQLADAYRIEGVPTLGIQGRFMTSPSIAGSPERALAVADALLVQARKG